MPDTWGWKRQYSFDILKEDIINGNEEIWELDSYYKKAIVQHKNNTMCISEIFNKAVTQSKKFLSSGLLDFSIKETSLLKAIGESSNFLEIFAFKNSRRFIESWSPSIRASICEHSNLAFPSSPLNRIIQMTIFDFFTCWYTFEA